MSFIHSPVHQRHRDLISVKNEQEFEEFTINTQHRRCTDILCIIIGVMFTLILMTIAFAFYNYQHYIQANFPTDTDGKLCGINYSGYSYVYFAKPNQITQRLCVQKCPSPTDTKLLCKATASRGCNFNAIQGYEVENYPTEAWQDRNGFFCMPKDKTARDQILYQSKLRSRNIFFNSKDTFILSSIIAIVVGIIYFILVQFFPKVINRFIIYIGAGMLFILTICIWTYPTDYIKSKVLIGLIFIAILIILALTVWLFRTAVDANGVFLNHATMLIAELPFVLINIPIFIGILIAFQYLMVLELNALWTHGDVNFNPTTSLYWQYNSSSAVFFKFLWFIQFLWGLTFIKESFNFVVSTYAVLWYNDQFSKDQDWKQKVACIFFPYKLLVTKHLGSVIACSFMTAFFNVADTIFDLIRGSRANGTNSCCNCLNGSSGFSERICSTLDYFFDLVRSEAMPYIAITGNTYCNAARYCQYLCEQSTVLQHSQSASRAYRFAAYSTLAGFITILSLYIHGRISIFGAGIIMVLSYFFINFFVQMHADTADGILIVFLQHEEMACRKMMSMNSMKNRTDFTRHEINQVDHKKTKQIVKELEYDRLFLDQKKNRIASE